MVTRRGLRVDSVDVIARVGQAGWAKILMNLVVKEKVQHGKPKHLGQAVRRAFTTEGKTLTFLPRAQISKLLESRVLTSLQDEEPLPEPRELDKKACELAMELYSYQNARSEIHLQHPFLCREGQDTLRGRLFANGHRPGKVARCAGRR